MGIGSGPSFGAVGSVDGGIPEAYGVDPSIAPGLPRPQGWRVALPDGSAAWDKTGPLNTDWTPITAAALVGVTQLIAGTNVTLSPPGGTGAVTVNANTQGDITAVNNGNGIVVATPTGPTPTVSADYGTNIQDVGSANAAGAGTKLAREDHVHEGVHEITAAEPALQVVASGADRSIASRAGRLIQALGLITETMPGRLACAGQASVSGTVYYQPVYLFAGEVITGLVCGIATAGVGVTRSRMGLYSAPGGGGAITQLAITADQGTAWETTGVKSANLTAPYTVPSDGIYLAALIEIATTTQANFHGTNNSVGNGPILDVAIGSGILPWGNQTAQTDLPSPGIYAAGNPTNLRWVGLY